jgi:hypothetical protein
MSYTQGQENFAVDRGLQDNPSPDIGRLKLEANIVLGDFIFNTIDEYGVVWVVTDMEGWWTPPGADIPTVERGFGDGAYEVRGRYQSRILKLKGSFLVPYPNLVEAARDRLIAATADLAFTGAWLKTGSDPIRASFVQLSGDIDIETVNIRGRTDFEIGLKAADPIKYSWNDANPDGYDSAEIPVRNTDNDIDGTGVITNIGNYSVPCYLEISGPFAGPGSIFNKTTEELIILTQGLKGSISRNVVNKQLTFDVPQLKDIATLTTTGRHDFTVGDSVFISGVGETFDGEKFIISTPTDTTFSYETEASTVIPVAFKSLTSAEATLKTTVEHGLSIGNSVVVDGVDSVFDGVYPIKRVPTPTSIVYDRVRVSPSTLISASLISNIATVNTSDAHQFIVGEQVTVTGAGTNYDGTYTITEIPSPTSFRYAATRTNAREITGRQMERSLIDDSVTLTTASPHGFLVGESVNVSGVNLSLDGGYTITSASAGSTTFSYERSRSTQKNVTVVARSSNVATLTTSEPHGFVVGEKVVVQAVFGAYSGTHTITSLPSATTFTFANTGADQVSTSIASSSSGGKATAGSRKIASILLAGNVVTVTTRSNHGAIFGEDITITGAGAPFDGNYVISAIPFLNVLQYEKTAPNVALITYPVDEQTGASPNIFVELSGNIDFANVSPVGQAEVGGGLPLAAITGTATVPPTVAETPTGGNIIRTNNVQFTPGLSGASAVVPADILEIDTKNREVAFNGELEGARGRVDVLADFIKLAPGDNELEFIDEGNPEGTSALRVYYRSGWLG